MKPVASASIRDLRYRFPEIEKRLRRGESIEIRKRNRIVGTLVPPQPLPPSEYPDFRTLRHQIWGNKVMKQSATELLRRGRDAH